jgi:hypothetical protein
MTTLHHRIETRAAPAALWNVLAELTSVGRTNPGVAEVAVLPGPTAGPGARRACRLKPKGRVVERVTHWTEGSVIGFEVVESDWPLSGMRWETRVLPGASGAGLSQVLSYRPKLGPLGWLMDRLMMRRMIGRAVETALRGAVAEAEGAR